MIEFCERLASNLSVGLSQRMAFRALYQSERRYDDMLSNMQLFAVTLDTEGILTYCNDYTLENTGYERNEIVGREWFEIFIPKELTEEIKDVFRRTISEDKFPATYENEIVTRTGERRLGGVV